MSTLVGASIDTALFFSLAFSSALVWLEPANDVAWANEVLPMLGVGPLAPLWASLAAADWMVKLSLALLALVEGSELQPAWNATMVRVNRISDKGELVTAGHPEGSYRSDLVGI